MIEDSINRRTFIKTTVKTASAGVAMLGMRNISLAGTPEITPIQNKLPRWRGFNFLNFFRPLLYDGFEPYPFDSTEQDFKWMADWGFDFVRLPMSYLYYVNYNTYGNKPITPEQTVSFNEEAIENIEKLIYLAHKYKLHVNLNLHRAPGFCINSERIAEPFNLWRDEEAQQAFYAHWEMWAKRFKDVSTKLLSFDLVNEPAGPVEAYRKIAVGCLEVIHRHNPGRLVIADGKNGGGTAIPEFKDLNIGQSCRGYHPGKISHFRNPWSGNINDPQLPVWNGVQDRKMMEDYYQPWIDLVNQGVGVHCGECGCYNKTPHDVFLAWFTDILDILTTNNIGWAMWNFRGSFGVVDSGRKDVEYKNWHGHKLDEKLLTILQKY